MKCSLKMFGSAVFAGLIALAGCGGGGGDSSPTTPTAAAATSVATPTPSATPTPVRFKTMDMRVPGGAAVEIEVQHQVAASVATSASAPAVAASAPVTLPVTSAGTVRATPVNQVVSLNRADGKYYGVSDAVGTYLVDPAKVVMICASSAQVGYSFLPGQSSRACAPPDLTTNTVVLPKTCNKDDVLYTMHVDNTGDAIPDAVLWFDWDPTSERRFTIPSDSPVAGVIQPDKAHVRWGDYSGATVKVVKTGAGKASITVDFGSNCVGAFGQKNDSEGTSGRLVDLSIEEGVTWLKFGWNSDKSSSDGKDGWGMQPWLDTVSNFTVAPSVVEGYLNFNTVTGNYFVTIPDVLCDSKGNITVYRGTKSGEAWIYEPGTTGADDPDKRPFGLGWLPIQANATETQLYTLVPDPSVTASFDRAKFNLVIGACN